jgi:uncharacterized membrane protein YfcA
MVDTETTLFLLIVFVSTLTRSTFGFGEALIAMPLLSLVLGVREVTPIVALVALVNGSAILSTDWRSVVWQSSWRLVASALVGIPLGVYVLTSVPESIVKIVLAALVITFSIYSLSRPELGKLATNRLSYLFGFCSGILGGAYNTSGPPLIIYGTLREWPPQHFRATLQSVMLPVGLFVTASHGVAGLWSWRVFRFALCALPIILITAPLGKWLNRRVDVQSFRRVVFLLLLVIGGMLLASALRSL